MKVDFVKKPPHHADNVRREKFSNALKKGKAVFLSRIEEYDELVVLVPSAGSQKQLFNWCWLDGSEGSYVSDTNMSIEQCVKICMMGSWELQENVTITVQSFKR